MNKTVTVRLFHDRRRARKDGTFPIRVEVQHRGKRKYYPTGLSLTDQDYAAATGRAPRGKNREHSQYLSYYLSKIQGAVQEIENFSFEKLNRALHQETAETQLKALFQRKAESSAAGTAAYYTDVMRSFEKYRAGAEVSEVDQPFLRGYEAYCKKAGIGTTTRAMYLRGLRAVLNMAIEEGLMSAEDYPFGKRGYRIPQSRGSKKALNRSELKALVQAQPRAVQETKALALWVFSYLCNGMNVKDILLLKWSDIDRKSQILTYTREKTKNTTGEAGQILIALLPQALAVIDQWGEPGGVYVFGYLNGGETDQEVLTQKKYLTKYINKYVKRIAEREGIETKVTTYTARHSFATMLKNSGTSIAYIQEALGHTDSKTTQRYLDSFTAEEKRAEAKKLLIFG